MTKKETTKMIIKISKAALSEALNNVQTVVGGKSTIAVLQNVKMSAKDGKVEFTCSDLDITLLARAECEVVEDGATTIPVKTFASAVSKLVEGEVKIEVDVQDHAKLSAGSTVFKFNGLSEKEFPTMPDADGNGVILPANAIREMFRKTSFAMSQDETRKSLSSVLLDFTEGGGKVSAVATDGRRLSLLKGDLGDAAAFNKQFVIPRKGVDIILKKMPKDGDCEIVTSGSQIRFKTAKLDFTMKLLEDAYPNYMQVVPKESKVSIPLNRAELIGAIDRISVFTAGSETPCMSLAFGDNKLVLTSNNTEFGEARDEMPIKYEGEKFNLKFNPDYIRDALNVIDEDEVEVFLNANNSPAIIRKAGTDDYTYVCMPLRI